MSSRKRKLQSDNATITTDDRPRKKIRSDVPKIPVEHIYEDIIGYYRMQQPAKFFEPSKMQSKLRSSTRFKTWSSGNGQYVMLGEILREDIVNECATWSCTVKNDIPKISIKNRYVDVRRVLICMYTPIEQIRAFLKELFKRNPPKVNRKTQFVASEKELDEKSDLDTLMYFVLHVRIMPSCDNKTCVNWRHCMNMTDQTCKKCFFLKLEQFTLARNYS